MEERFQNGVQKFSMDLEKASMLRHCLGLLHPSLLHVHVTDWVDGLISFQDAFCKKC